MRDIRGVREMGEARTWLIHYVVQFDGRTIYGNYHRRAFFLNQDAIESTEVIIAIENAYPEGSVTNLGFSEYPREE